MTDYQAVVVGGGPAGLAAACLLAREGIAAALIAPPPKADPRTAALMQPTLQLLSYLGIWPGTLQPLAAPLRRQKIIDDTGSMVRAPDLTFIASEMGLDAFAWNIPLAALIPSLRGLADASMVRIFNQPALRSETRADGIMITLADGTCINAKVCLAADGANSVMRTQAGINTETWQYDQSALVSSVSHSEPHDDTSIEFHKRHGPCTIVPLPGRRSAIVWMERPQRAAELAELPDAEFVAELQAAMHGQLGLLSDPSLRQLFPMRGLTANRFAAGRTILIGESAHVVPPIGAQGLNMSFRDVAFAVDLMAGEHDPGNGKIIAAYNSKRKAEVLPRQGMIAAMNSSLLLGMLPLDAARAAALWAIHGLAPLRAEIMRHGLGISGPLPFAMRASA